MRSRTSYDEPPSRSFICTICSRQFKRSDTLLRHQRVHSNDIHSRKSRRTSCTACVKSKKRCSKQRPSCETCTKNNLICIYEDSKGLPGFTIEEGLSAAEPDGNSSAFLAPDIPGLPAEGNFDHRVPGFDGFQEQGNVDPALWNTGLDWDWLFDCGENMDLAAPIGIWPNYENPSGHHVLELTSTMPRHILGSMIDDSLTMDDDQNNTVSSVLPSPEPQDTCEPNDPWPLEWHAEGQQPLDLPKLDDEADGPEATYYGLKSLGDVFRNKLQEAIRLPLERPPWRAVSLANFPSKIQLDRCIDLFFAHNNTAFGILHRPTFQADREPVVLILAVASVGACYSNMGGSHNFANALSELNRRLLWYMGESDPRFLRSTFYITAQLLQNRHGYCSGSKRLFELSESTRSILINNAMSIGIFQEAVSSEQEDDSDVIRWKKWIKTESICRLAWAIYVHDASVTYLGNKRPCVSLASLYQMSLPSSSELWEAESAQAWSALHPWSKTAPQRTSFSSAIGTLSTARDIEDPQHQYIVILTYTRMLWSMKEITASPIVSLNNSRLKNYEGDKRDLIEALDQILARCRLFNPCLTENPELLRSAMRNAQIIHMCHLQAAGHFMDWLHPLIRGGPNSERAHQSLLLWADKNPRKIREVAYHSAQIMAITRRYPQNLSLEPLNAFHSGIALWCVAGLLMRRCSDKPCRPENIRLDVLAPEESMDLNQAPGYVNGPISPDIQSWIQGDELYGSAVLSVHGVPDIACTEGRKRILLQVAETLHRNKVWGIAQSFLAVIRQLISAEEPSS